MYINKRLIMYKSNHEIQTYLRTSLQTPLKTSPIKCCTSHINKYKGTKKEL